MRIVCLLAALLLAGCGAAATPSLARRSAPPAAAPSAATPNRDAAQQVDPRRLRAEPAAYEGWNVLVWGTARGVAADANGVALTLDAYGPNLIRQPLPATLPPATPVEEGGCYYVYALVAGGALRGYRVEQIVAGDKLATCGT